MLRAPWTTILLSIAVLFSLLIPIHGISGHLEPLKRPFQAVDLVLGEDPHQRAIAKIEDW